MSRTTIFALLAFVALLGAVLVIQIAPSDPAERQLSVKGWKAAAEAEAKAKEEAEDAAKAAAGEAPSSVEAEVEGAATAAPKPEKELFSPIDRIELTRGGETVILEQRGDDKKKWVMTKPREANVDWFRLRPILDRFQEPVESSLGKAVAPDDLRLFKLDPAHRIHLKLFEGGKVYADLVVGGTEKAEQEGAQGAPGQIAVDTWVMAPGDETRAYRMPGVDLRTVVDKSASDLRGKKVFDREKDGVNRIVVENPDDERYPRIVLVREAAGSDGAGEAKTGGGWRFETPKGFRPGAIDAYLSTVLGLHAAEFLAADDAAGAAALAGDKVARVTIETGDGSIVLHVSAPDDKVGYVRIDGADEIIKINQYSAGNLRKTLSDLRDKKLFPFAPEDVTAVRLESDKGSIHVRMQDGAWVAEKPAGLSVGRKQMDTLLRDISALNVSEWSGSLPPAETGLATPSVRAVIETNGGVHSLLLGREEGGKTYGTLEGSAEVFLMSGFNAKRLAKSADDLEDRSVFGLAPDAVVKVEVHPPKAPQGYVLGREGGAGADWTLLEGDGTAPATTASAVKKGPAAALVAGLANLEVKETVADRSPAEVGLEDGAWRLTVVAANGRRATLWLGADAEGPTLHARTDAPAWAGQVFTIPTAQAKMLMKTAGDLKADGTDG